MSQKASESPFTKVPACCSSSSLFSRSSASDKHADGHRGASHDYPENTIASFRQAIADGSEGLESDGKSTFTHEIG